VPIVSKDVAARSWPGSNPLGRRWRMGAPDEPDTRKTLVGITYVTRTRDLGEPQATLYLPASQFLNAAGILMRRTAFPPGQVVSRARARDYANDPDVPVIQVVAFAGPIDAPFARPWFQTFPLVTFEVGTLILATVELYAALARWIRQRGTEIAVRITRGATISHVRRLVVGEGLRWTGPADRDSETHRHDGPHASQVILLGIPVSGRYRDNNARSIASAIIR